ncbi:homeobox protein Hmx-like [Mya arenaria]|uniref:homeobox protein Hmx-like n=1 Tax=Mya arenaria TaxID=6604 RepID=UPI0022DFF837|nr:homeobox protein Hmx-like [Mya arenaria]
MEGNNIKKTLPFSIESILSKDSSNKPENTSKYSPYRNDVTVTAPSAGDVRNAMASRVFLAEGIAERLGQNSSYSEDSDDDDSGDVFDSPMKTSSTTHDEDMTSSPEERLTTAISKCKAKKKTRTVFSRQQVFYLEAAFDAKRYLSSAERSEIATSLNLTETQVKVWFQNRRNKWKAQLNGDEKGLSVENTPVYMPPFLCSSMAAAAAHAHRTQQGLPPLPFFRQPVFY